MGRLTLNVLLSFAQFEREVTGERIRDKIAASKARGMWMGGTLPFGYDLPAEGRRALLVNPDEAATVRHDLRQLPRARLGQRAGALARRAGHRHQAADHPQRPAHRRPAVQSRRALLPAAQPHLPRDDRARGQGLPGHASGDRRPGALRGRADPARREPATACGAAGPGGAGAADRPRLRCRRASHVALVQLWPPQQALPLLCLGAADAGAAAPPGRYGHPSGPGPALEALLTGILRRLAPSAASDPLDLPTRVEIHATSVQLLLPAALAQGLHHRLHDGEMLAADRDDPSRLRLVLPLRMQLHGGRTWIVTTEEAPARPDPVLIRALRTAHALVGHDAGGEPMLEAIPASPYHRRLLRLAFLAPELQRAILAGRQPPGLTLKHLLEQRLPLLWSEQLRRFDPATSA